MAAEKRINGKVYRVDKLPAEEAIPLLYRVGRFFREVSTALASLSSDKEELRPGDALFFTALTETGDGDEALDLLKYCVGKCQVDGDAAILGVHAQSIDEAADLAWFFLRAQFKDFLAARLASGRKNETAQAKIST